MRITLIAGTRPEVIKLGPLYQVLTQAPAFRDWRVAFVLTGQHQALARQAAHDFDIAPDAMLEGFAPGAIGMAGVVAALMARVAQRIDGNPTDIIVVQGDTNSALAGAMAGFYSGIPVAHVEAGLRTGNPADPFPEEMNRRLIAHLASLHFAPTRRAADMLIREGVAAERIVVTGNTVVDAVHAIAGTNPAAPGDDGDETAQILVTCHRRENWSHGIEEICQAVKLIAARHPHLRFVFPTHGNPAVADRARAALAGVSAVRLTPPLAYAEFLGLMRRARLVITDSGGVQEEAYCFGLPVVVVRSGTERPEGLSAGLNHLCPPQAEAIAALAAAILDQPDSRAHDPNPFGDGHAAERIAAAIAAWDRHRPLHRPQLAMADLVHAMVGP